MVGLLELGAAESSRNSAKPAGPGEANLALLSQQRRSNRYDARSLSLPAPVREKLRIKPGQKVQAFAVGDRIELVPVVPLEQLKGFLKGLVPDFEREPARL